MAVEAWVLGWIKRYLPAILGAIVGITVSYLVLSLGPVVLAFVWLLIVLGVVAAYAAIWRSAAKTITGSRTQPDLLAGEVEVLSTQLSASFNDPIASCSKAFTRGDLLDVVIDASAFDEYDFYMLDSQDIGRLLSKRALDRIKPLISAHVKQRHKEVVTIPRQDIWHFAISVGERSYVAAELRVYAFTRDE